MPPVSVTTQPPTLPHPPSHAPLSDRQLAWALPRSSCCCKKPRPAVLVQEAAAAVWRHDGRRAAEEVRALRPPARLQAAGDLRCTLAHACIGGGWRGDGVGGGAKQLGAVRQPSVVLEAAPSSRDMDPQCEVKSQESGGSGAHKSKGSTASSTPPAELLRNSASAPPCTAPARCSRCSGVFADSPRGRSTAQRGGQGRRPRRRGVTHETLWFGRDTRRLLSILEKCQSLQVWQPSPMTKLMLVVFDILKPLSQFYAASITLRNPATCTWL